MDENAYKKIVDEAFKGSFDEEAIKEIAVEHKTDILEACQNDDGALPEDMGILKRRIVSIGRICYDGYREGYTKGLLEGSGQAFGIMKFGRFDI